MQIVYLSARPELLTETLDHVRHYGPFIDDVVVVTPERLADRFDGVDTVLTDEAVTGRTRAGLDALDHTTRNYVVRASAVRHESIAETFIMSDDDSRPVVPIDGTTFLDGDRHRRRWFHTLSSWRRTTTPFDAGQLHTWIILRQLGIPEPLSYASHLPQLIDRDLYVEVATRLEHYAERYPLDEWSSYLNLAPRIEPARFADPEPFVTLGWPSYPGEWPHEVTPPRYVFENHHPELYRDDGLYAGLPTGLDPDTADAVNLEKMMRWHSLDVRVRDLDFPDDVDQPWTTSPARKVAFKGLRAARSAYRYVALDDRARLSELEGRLRRLEAEHGPHDGAG